MFPFGLDMVNFRFRLQRFGVILNVIAHRFGHRTDSIHSARKSSSMSIAASSFAVAPGAAWPAAFSLTIRATAVSDADGNSLATGAL